MAWVLHDEAADENPSLLLQLLNAKILNPPLEMNHTHTALSAQPEPEVSTQKLPICWSRKIITVPTFFPKFEICTQT